MESSIIERIGRARDRQYSEESNSMFDNSVKFRSVHQKYTMKSKPKPMNEKARTTFHTVIL
jgi:hypothetical protein